MPPRNLKRFISLLAATPDLCAARKELGKHPNLITDSFFMALFDMGTAVSNSGDLQRAIQIFHIGMTAAKLNQERYFRLRFALEIYTAKLSTGRLGHLELCFQVIRKQAEALLREEEHLDMQELLAIILYDQAELARQLQKWDAARGFYVEYWKQAQELRQAGEQVTWLSKAGLYALTGLISACEAQDDMESALGYAMQLLDLYSESLTTGPDPNIGPSVYSALYLLASSLYYKYENFEQASLLLEHILVLFPEEYGALKLQAYCFSRLERSEDALRLWEKIVSDSSDAQDHYNYAVLLAQLGQTDAALEAASKALQLDPALLNGLILRGGLYQQTGAYEAGIADFTRLLQIIENDTSTDDDVSMEPKSQIEYERHMPKRDQMDMARICRINCNAALGRIEDALRDIEVFLETGDTIMQAYAHGFLGDQHMEKGQLEAAIQEYERAVQLSPAEHEYRLKRVDACIAQKKFSEAMPDLAFLASREQEPKSAIERLSSILEREPDLALARKWRGFAYFELGQAAHAVEDLEVAAQHLPEDADVLYWLGLANITFEIEDFNSQWNEAFSGLRVRDAISYLGKAAVLSPQHEAKAAYQWLVDRAALDDLLFIWLQVGFPPESYLSQLFPEVTEALWVHRQSADAAENGDWETSTAILLESVDRLSSAGYHLLAGRMHLDLARNSLRLYKIQDALNHLHVAKDLIFLIATPLTAHLQENARQLQLTAKYGQEKVSIELDYLTLFRFAHSDYLELTTNALEAEIWASLRDHEKAGDILEHIDLDREKLAWISNNPFRQHWVHELLTSLVQSYYMLAELSKALSLLGLMERLAQTEEQKKKALLFRGFINKDLGQTSEAMDDLSQVKNWARANSKFFLEYYIPSTIAICRVYYDDGDYDAAYELLRPLSYNLDNIRWHSSAERFEVLILWSLVSERLGQELYAQKAILTALSEIDAVRNELTAITVRLQWQARHEAFYRMAVPLIWKYSDPVSAFDILEMSKSRAFLDLLSINLLPLPEETASLLKIEAELLENRRLLNDLNEYGEIGVSGFINYDILKKLNILTELDEQKELTRELILSRVENEITDTDVALSKITADIEDAKLSHYGNAMKNLVSYHELCDAIRI